MAFTVEDGTGVKDANSYGTLQGFKDYFGDRPEDVSAILDATIQALLVAATDYIDTRWGARFLGRREWFSLHSRSILTLTDVPSDGEEVVFGDNTYTFRTTPSADSDVEIGVDAFESLDNLASVVGSVDTDQFLGARLVDEDAVSVAFFGDRDGLVTTTTLGDGAWSAATTTGKSRLQQPLEFPRVYLYDAAGQLVVGVPRKLRAATYEYAYRANSTTLAPDPTIDPTGRVLTGTRSKVGPIEVETQFADEIGTIIITKPFPTADRMLREFVRAGGPIR